MQLPEIQMKILKTLSLIITLIVVVVVGGISYLITTFDANHYKKQIIEQVKKETGRDLSLPGDVDLKFFPSIALSVGEARLSSSEGFGDKDFAIIKKAKIAVELMPLLNRKLKIKEVQLDGLELDLLIKADGSTSWGDLAESKSGNASASSEPSQKKNSSKVVEDLLGNLSIAGLNLRDATVHWHDIPKSQKISITSLQLATGVFKQGSPLDVSYSVQLLQHKPLLKLAAKGKTTVTLSENNQYFSLENLILDLQASSDLIPNGQLDVVLEGDIAGSLKQLKAPNLELKLSLNGDLVPEGVLKAHLTANVDVDLL
ncbi:MAG TPA: AsmA family protein, partial [Thiotrichaceae bacterium]|nr:AsmA family protein [Thiotrichaceae bacterium]